MVKSVLALPDTPDGTFISHIQMDVGEEVGERSGWISTATCDLPPCFWGLPFQPEETHSLKIALSK